jgi:hypothetical protein
MIENICVYGIEGLVCGEIALKVYGVLSCCYVLIFLVFYFIFRNNQEAAQQEFPCQEVSCSYCRCSLTESERSDCCPLQSNIKEAANRGGVTDALGSNSVTTPRRKSLYNPYWHSDGRKRIKGDKSI